MPETAAGRAALSAILNNRQILDSTVVHGVSMGEVREVAREARALGRAEALAELECPAAKHHRMLRQRAPRLLAITDDGAEYGAPSLISDTCTACGHDFGEEPHA